MADALKRLFTRMTHTSEELKSLQEAPDASNEKLAQARRRERKSWKIVRMQSEGGLQIAKVRRGARGTSSEPVTIKRSPYYQDLINEPLPPDSPPPKPAPRDAKILPFQDPSPGGVLPYSENRNETLPRNVTPDPARILPGIFPSRHNPDVSDMRKVYPNIYFNKRDENSQRKGMKGNAVESEEEQNVLGTPFTASEARNLLRLGWIALEFLRDDRRPCCIVEVSKNNVTLKHPAGPSTLARNLRKTDLDTGITTMADASDPGTISQLMKSVEAQIMEEGDSMPKSLPRIMFENQAFLSARKRLEPELGPALASALQEEPPRTVTQGVSAGMLNSSDFQQGRWMKQEEAAVDKRKVQREFMDHEGKMWRITSIDITPDIGKDPLSRTTEEAEESTKKTDSSEDEDRSDHSGRGAKRAKGSSNSTTKGWKVFYVESVFPTPVGVDWPTSSGSSIEGSLSRATTFPSTETRSSGNDTSAGFSSSSTFQETVVDGKRSFTRTTASTHKTSQNFRRMSIPEETDLTESSEVKAIATAVRIQTDGTLNKDLQPENGLGARVKVTRSPVGHNIELSAFAGLRGSPHHIDGYDSILEASSSMKSVPSDHRHLEQGAAMPVFWTTISPQGRGYGGNAPAKSDDNPPSESGRPVLDWTRGDIGSIDEELAEHYALLRSIPW